MLRGPYVVFSGFVMRLDYSPAVLAPRRSARRSLLVATLCVVSLSAVVSRESIAKRSAVPPQTLTRFDTAAATVDAEEAFDEAIQSALADTTLQVPAPSEWKTVTVQRGATLSTIFEGQGLGNSESLEIVRLSKDAARLKVLRTGDKLHLLKNAEGKLSELTYELDETHTLQVRRVDDRLEAFTIAAEIQRRPAQAYGVIDSSLFAAGDRAGLSDRLTMELAELFGYDIDFALDLRQGDRFAVVYDELYKNGAKLRDGSIIAAEFVNQGRTHRVMRYEDVDGNDAYYTPEGQSLRKAFIRTPVDFARVSSGFNLRRRHPILNTIRAHKGVDYAAATGTPVKATGDGRIEFIGNKGGYGRVIILKHGSQYTTLYAHLSRYRSGLKVGSRIKQGQVIGYVGSSGLATAPHLHYEFRQHGIHKNPMTVAVPRANSLPRNTVAVWQAQRAPVLAQLDAMSQTLVAQASGVLPVKAAAP